MNFNGQESRAIKEVLSAIKVASPHEFAFSGRTFHVQGAGHQHAGHQHGAHQHAGHEHAGHQHAGHQHAGHQHAGQAAPDPQSQAFVATLSAYLYEYAYSHPFSDRVPESAGHDLSIDFGLLEAMSLANTTRERWEHGWQIARVLQHGQISAQKGSVQRNLWPGQFLSKDGPASMPRQGAEISVFYAKESRSLQTGFYYAFGEAAEDDTSGFGLVRLYWNISFEGAPRLVGLITSRLNRFHVPFRLKAATARSQFNRTDVAVVYLAKRYFRIVTELMLDVHPEIEDALGDDVPLFSKRLAKGLGVAEDPGTSESFGQSRCRRMAEAVWNCYLRDEQTTEARWAEFRRQLQGAGIDPELPHLNAGSLDWYELPWEAA
jgi:hypothetical protein